MINLNTAYDPGSLDSGASYTHVEITNVSFNVEHQAINLSLMYGTAPSGNFLQGKSSAGSFRIANDGQSGTDWDVFEALTAVDGTEKCVDAFTRALCQWLLNKSHFAGTIV